MKVRRKLVPADAWTGGEVGAAMRAGLGRPMAADDDAVRRLGQALESVGATGPASAVARAFDLMGIAEEEIATAMRRWPKKATELNATFGILYPGILSGYGDGLYRAHCRELLGRVVHGEALALGTDAECLAILSSASQAAPLDSDHAAAMTRCFRSCYPDREVEDAGHESYPGRVDEILRRITRKRWGR